MSYELKGKVIVKNDIEEVSDKFRKREFVVEKTDENNGQTFVSNIKFQLTQKSCSILDDVNVGDDVNVTFNIKGNAWTKNGQTSYFNNLDAWKIDVLSGNKEELFSSTPSTPAQNDDFDDELPF